MKLVKYLFFCFICFADIHVRANEVSDQCWGKIIPCAYEAQHVRSILEHEGSRIALANQAVVQQLKIGSIHLVLGRALIEARAPLEVVTPYAKVRCLSECKALFERKLNNLTVMNLAGTWTIERTGDKESYSLPTALQVELSEVGSDGKANMEFPQSLPWMSVAIEWAKLYPGKIDDYKAELEEFRVLWKEAVEAASALHEEEVKRVLASYQANQDEIRARQRAREKEDESLRSLFRQKNYINQ